MLGRALALAGLVLLSSVAWAAPGERWYRLADPLFFHYGAGDGLPSGSIASIAQDERGLVWLATSGGLVRWDGRVARPVPVRIEGADPGFREILPGSGADMWLTTGSGLVRFDPVTEAFEAVPHERELAVLDADFGRDPGVAWVAAEQGVARVDLATGATRLWLEEREARVFDVLLVGDEVWAGTEAGLFRKVPGAEEFELFQLGPDVPPDTRIASLIRVESGDIWVGTARRGVFVIGPDQQASPVAIPDFHQEWVYAMVEVEPGVVWLGTFGGGVVEIRQRQGQVRRLNNNRLAPHSLVQDEVYDLYRDRDGRIWVGTRRGVSVHDPRQRAVAAVFGDVGRNGGIRDEAVRAVHAGSGGLVWLGLGESGVDALDPVRGRVATIAANGDDPANALPGGAVETLVELADGTLLVGSNWGVYEYREGALRRIDAQGGPGDSYVGNLLTDGETVWAGGTGGLWRLWREAGDWRAEQVEADLTDPRVTEMAMAPGGGLVVGTWDGVNWLGPDGGVRAALSGSSADGPITGSAFVTALRHDADGRLWMGTSGGGLYRIDGPEDASGLLRLGREDGLPSEVVRTLEFDGNGRLWVATSAGLAVIDTGTLGVYSLETADGDVFAPYARNASARTQTGELLFGGDGGLLVVEPELWRIEALEPTLAVVDLRVGDGSAGLDVGDSADDPVVVPAEANRISIEFAALDYGATRQWRYRYRLAGFENDWYFADEAHRSATYTSLPPGNYRFLVQSDDGMGGWASNETSIHVRVMPLWYQTAWGRALVAAALLVVLVLAVRWWNRRMYRRQQQLEGLVRHRTSELEASGEELRRKSRELEEASTTDALTGLRNRRFLDENMKRDVAQVVRRYRDAPRRAQQAPDMLIFLVDFDAFKRVNDDHGHAAGDAVLIEMRRRLERLFRETDYLVRWGGEEFLVVARNVHREHAEDLAERLRLMVRQEPFEIGDERFVDMTCSIGLAPFPFDTRDPDGMSWQECAEIADRCLYAAKKAGRDAWFYARPGDIGAADLSARQVRNDFWNLADSGVLELTSNLRG